MFKVSLLAILLWISAATATAGVINVEFKFTPFVGDPEKSDKVETVPGKAWVFINNVPFAKQEVRKDEAQVLFEERDISPSVWVPTRSLGAALRKGKNTIRIEFEPADSEKPYKAQLSWAMVMDEATESSEGGRYRATNESGTGKETKNTKGKVVLQREFVADFAADLPWHHYPPVTSLSEDDKKGLALLVEKRAAGFKPGFGPIYELLGKKSDLDLKEMKKAKCLDKAYTAGVRIKAPARDQLDLATTGNPEVLVSRKGGVPLYQLDEATFEHIRDEDMKMCAEVAVAIAFPPRLVVVRSPEGKWEVVY
jgi:hypothetical protein